MTFDEIMARVKEMAKDVDASGTDFLAVQVNLTGKDGGVFYVEVKDGKVSAEPYDYHDRSCALTLEPANFVKLMDGKLDPVIAYTTGKLKVEGDLGKALEFSKLIKM
ncbi:MAG: SCP2 sterol-binding domain-containing protein [Lachnospiraceae bacterium]|nr:SCP2 sterol-binding domain-containing protein [Ruminococcus sp.]MCM1275515.1 SCP2 sterol-binding domain-containing protein [Lachnospiraceae bacterium]